MTLTPLQKEHVIELIKKGEKNNAVRYLQSTSNITDEEALLLTEKLSEEEPSVASAEASLQEKAQRPTNYSVAGAIFILIGALLVAFAANTILANRNFEQRAIPVKGKVIGFKTSMGIDDDGDSTHLIYTPNFQYKVNGKPYTQLGDITSPTQSYQINETVDMLIDPQAPHQILIPGEQWGFPIAAGLGGVIFVAIGYFIVRYSLKSQ